MEEITDKEDTLGIGVARNGVDPAPVTGADVFVQVVDLAKSCCIPAYGGR